MQVNIYIGVDSRNPRKSDKHYIYVLSCHISGREVTKLGRGSCEATYHGATLAAIAEALSRMKKASSICIHAEDEFALTMMEGRLPQWAAGGFTARIANKAEWEKVWERIQGHSIRTSSGTHEYTRWMKGELSDSKNQKEKEALQEHPAGERGQEVLPVHD